MSRLIYLLGGAVVGAAGLAAAALLNEKNSNSTSLDVPHLGSASSLDADALAGQLNSYFFKANAFAMKCSGLVMESGHLQYTPIDLPDDGFFMRTWNKLGCKLTEGSRACKRDSMLDIKKEAEQLYAQHRDVFSTANALLEQHGMQKISCKEVTFDGQDFSLNNELSNDDWILEFGELSEKIQDFLNKSAAIAEQLISRLEQIQGENVINNGKTSAALPA
ncbi:hypothetical protein LJB81_00555 [Desulfovibrio sp. OttesenSCG-928-M14]|nr:hypothetical protein [Desulfovibrio sp. OttesenSCG-928-M14]